MSLTKSISKTYVLALSLLSPLAWSAGPELLSPWSGLPLTQSCQNDYQRGFEVYKEAIEKRLNNWKDFFSEKEKLITAACRADFSLGLLDARLNIQQTILVEYLWELDFAARRYFREADKAAAYRNAMKTLFEQKLKHAFIGGEILSKVDLTNEETQKGLQLMIKNLREQAKERNQPAQFGRFVVVQKPHPLTTVDYVLSADGKLEELSTGELKVEKGSYQIEAERIFQASVEVAQAYLDYRPKMIFGRDSLLASVLQEYFYGTDFFKTPRGVREMAPFDAMMKLMTAGQEMHLNVRPLIEIQQHMIKKQNAILERDVSASKAFLTGVVLLPVLPYAIKFGTWAFVTYGTSITTAGTVVTTSMGALKLKLGAFLLSHATTLSIASAAVGFVGAQSYGIYQAIGEYRRDPENFGIGHLADAILVGAVAAVPVAVISPALVAGGTYIVGETLTFIGQMSVGYRYLRRFGLEHAAVTFVKAAPGALLKAWTGAWWKKEGTRIIFNTKFIAFVGAYNTSTVFAEIVMRELNDDPERKFWTPNGVNRKSLYSLTQKVGVSILTAPVVKIDGMWQRWFTWRLIDFISSSVVTSIIDGNTGGKKEGDKYVAFEMMYGSTVGAVIGDVERSIQMNVMNSSLSSWKSFLLGTALKAIPAFVKAPVRNYFLDLYYGEINQTPDQIKKNIRENAGFEIRNFSDEEILEGVKIFRADPEIPELLKFDPAA